MLLAILAPMQKEFALARRWLCNAVAVEGVAFPLLRGRVAGIEVLLAECGIGKVHAALTAYELVRRFTPDHLFNVGVCGGLHESLEPGDIVMSDALVYHDVWCGAGNAFGQIQGLPPRFYAPLESVRIFTRSACRIRVGLFCCGEYFVPTADEVARIASHFPEALAVDMESGAIAQVAYLQGVPYLSLRVVSDTPCRLVDHAGQYEDFWNRLADSAFSLMGSIFADYCMQIKG